MSEDKKRDRKTNEAKHRFGRFWSTFAVAAIICFLIWKIILWNCRSPDEQLAAIEASLAIPDSENAGIAYLKLAEDYLPLPMDPAIVNKQALILTREKPWHSNNYPKLAEWLEERQDLILKLLEISKMDKCRLPILSDRQQVYFTNPVRQMNGWAVLIVRSANLDAGEGRIDDAIEKYTCILQMSSHLRQQPVLFYYNRGVAIESLALQSLEKLITQTKLTDKQLTAIEAVLLPPKNIWKQDSKMIVKVRRIFKQKQQRSTPSITDWRMYWKYWKAMSKTDDDLLNRTHQFRLYTLANRRRIYLLIALRRFKNQTGHWPQSLDQIKPPLSEETLTDPRDNKPFVYEMKGEDFTLDNK